MKEIGRFDENEKPTEKWKRYYENGQLWNVLKFKNGIFIGKWKFYNENGELTNIKHFENGITENFHKNGRLSIVGKYKNGIDRIGEWK